PTHRFRFPARDVHGGQVVRSTARPAPRHSPVAHDPIPFLPDPLPHRALLMANALVHDITEKWKAQDAYDTYGVRHWGKGYFGVNAHGHVVVHPDKNPDRAIDLKDLIDQLQARGIQLPILLRFTDILRHRVGEIHDAFQAASKEFDYAGRYCCVYPIKVNQQRHVVEEILDFGKPYSFGLEAGSKPELLAVLALTNGHQTPIICNGFKDDEIIRMAMLARKIGKAIIP